jgi:hypothetical protein
MPWLTYYVEAIGSCALFGVVPLCVRFYILRKPLEGFLSMSAVFILCCAIPYTIIPVLTGVRVTYQMWPVTLSMYCLCGEALSYGGEWNVPGCREGRKETKFGLLKAYFAVCAAVIIVNARYIPLMDFHSDTPLTARIFWYAAICLISVTCFCVWPLLSRFAILRCPVRTFHAIAINFIAAVLFPFFILGVPSLLIFIFYRHSPAAISSEKDLILISISLLWYIVSECYNPFLLSSPISQIMIDHGAKTLLINALSGYLDTFNTVLFLYLAYKILAYPRAPRQINLTPYWRGEGIHQ